MHAVCLEPFKINLTRIPVGQATVFGGTIHLLMSCHLVLNLRDEYYLPRGVQSGDTTQLGPIHTRDGEGIHQLDSMGLPRISSWYSHQHEDG